MAYFICGLLLYVHLTACIWCGFAQIENRSWLTEKVEALAEGGEVVLLTDKKKVYILALYYIIQTVTTVGYGDISGTSTAERVFQLAAMLIGVIAFLFIAGTLSSMISTFDEIMAEKKRNSERLA